MRILLGIWIVLFLAGDVQAKDVYGAVCKPGIHYNHNKHFALYVFCDDASGTNIGIIAIEGNINPGSDPHQWSLTNRFWQEDAWAADVYNYSWSDDGKYVFVTTDDIYGTGKKYALDLLNKTYEEVGDGHHSSREDAPSNTAKPK